MREFFRGWRRKVGCVTLVMALAVMACWMRSFAVRDVLTTIPLFGHGHMLTSETGGLEWVCWKATSPRSQFPAGWRSQHLQSTKFNTRPLYRRVHGTMLTASLAGTHVEGFVTPHWMIAIPLTVLCAYLFLWPQRKPPKSQATDDDPTVQRRTLEQAQILPSGRS